MSENFNNGTNSFTEPNSDGQNAPDASQGTYTPPVSNPASYTPPVYSGSNGQYASSGQYMPYGSYVPQSSKPEAPKKPSRDKKKGLIAALIILFAIFLISVAVIVGSFIYKAFNSDVPRENKGDGTKLEIVNPPAKTENDGQSDGGMSSNAVYEKIQESSVGVLVYAKNQQQLYSEGTGIIMGVNSDNTATYIITCAHVIDAQSPSVVVQTHDGEQYDAIIVGMDSKTDIGLIRVNKTGFKAAEFANSDNVKVGDWVYAIGNPGGTQFFGSYTNGMVSAIGRPVDSPVGYEVSCIQHTAAINPGNSGGALVNAYGQVIGINSSKIASTDYEGMGFSVPSTTVKEIVDELIKNGRVTNRPVLGIQFKAAVSSQLHSYIIKSNSLPAGSIIISNISRSSDLKNKDVKAGDMITAVNGKDLETYNVLMEVIEKGKVGDEITLTICRVDSDYHITTFDVTVKLVEDTGETYSQEPETQNFQFPF